MVSFLKNRLLFNIFYCFCMHPNIRNVCLQNKHFVYLGVYISKSKQSQKAKPWVYYFYVNLKILADFHICISVPLTWHHLTKPQKRCSVCRCNHCRLDSPCICQRTSQYLCSICKLFHGYFSLVKTSGPTTKAAGTEVLLNSLRESIQVRFVKNNNSIVFLNNSPIVQASKTYCGEISANEREAIATAKIYRI